MINDTKLQAAMRRAGCLLALAAAFSGARCARAGALLYTIGADPLGAPTSLNSMNGSSSSSVTNVQTPLGDGSIGFNGGLVYSGGLIYGIGNDNNNDATLYSFDTSGQNLTVQSFQFNTTGAATGFVFENGLAAIGNTLYAIGADSNGEELFQIGNGSATLVRGLATLGGTYSGLVYDPSSGEFYALIDNASGAYSGDYLVEFGLSGGTSLVASLTSLDHAAIGTHLDGLADAGGGVLYDIYMNPSTFTGQLEQITVGGSVTTNTLYDTQIPLAQDAGIALVSEAPEPASCFLTGGALALAGLFLRRQGR